MSECSNCDKIIDEKLDNCANCSTRSEGPKIENQTASRQAIIYVFADEDAFKINTKDGSFYVCADVMSENCDYFRALMNSNLKEAREKEVTFPDLSLSTLEEVIKFCHLGTCSITKDNVDKLILAASRLQNNNLLGQCCGEAMHLVDDENYLKLFILGTTIGQPDLIEAATYYFTGHFMQAVECDDYIRMDYDDLYELFTYSHRTLIRYYRQNYIMEAIFKWFNGHSSLDETS